MAAPGLPLSTDCSRSRVGRLGARWSESSGNRANRRNCFLPASVQTPSDCQRKKAPHGDFACLARSQSRNQSSESVRSLLPCSFPAGRCWSLMPRRALNFPATPPVIGLPGRSTQSDGARLAQKKLQLGEGPSPPWVARSIDGAGRCIACASARSASCLHAMQHGARPGRTAHANPRAKSRIGQGRLPRRAASPLLHGVQALRRRARRGIIGPPSA